jgi:hypothetical protein
MIEYLWIAILLGFLFIISMIWAALSLKDLKTPTHQLVKFEKKVTKAISGVILPPRRN